MSLNPNIFYFGPLVISGSTFVSADTSSVTTYQGDFTGTLQGTASFSQTSSYISGSISNIGDTFTTPPVNSIVTLTQAEYELCRSWDVEETEQYLNNIGGGRWLNINVYSEAEHDERQYRMECGL